MQSLSSSQRDFSSTMSPLLEEGVSLYDDEDCCQEENTDTYATKHQTLRRSLHPRDETMLLCGVGDDSETTTTPDFFDESANFLDIFVADNNSILPMEMGESTQTLVTSNTGGAMNSTTTTGGRFWSSSSTTLGIANLSASTTDADYYDEEDVDEDLDYTQHQHTRNRWGEQEDRSNRGCSTRYGRNETNSGDGLPTAAAHQLPVKPRRSVSPLSQHQHQRQRQHQPRKPCRTKSRSQSPPKERRQASADPNDNDMKPSPPKGGGGVTATTMRDAILYSYNNSLGRTTTAATTANGDIGSDQRNKKKKRSPVVTPPRRVYSLTA